MKIKQFLVDNWTLIVYLVISIIAVLPFLGSGFFQIHDDVQVARVFEMAKSLSAGMFPARWVPDLGYGAGYPIFNFYSVLPYYIGGFLTTLGLNALFSTKVVFVAGIIGSGVSMYFLTKSFFGRVPALVSAIIYLYFPYHAVNIYVRGDLAELFAYLFLPLVFLSFYKIHEIGRYTKFYIALGSTSIAAVIISHNLSFLMLLPFMVIFILVSVITGKERKQLFVSYAAVIFLAFLISAFYAIPAALEARFTNVTSVLGGGSDPRDHFICISQLWDSPWGFGGSAPGCADGISFKLGKSNVIFALLGIILALISTKRLKEKKFVVLSSIGFLVFSIFMLLPLSLPIWILPLMAFLQFPWRFLNFVGLFTSILIGFAVWEIRSLRNRKFLIVISVLIIGATLLLNAKLFAPQRVFSRASSYYTNTNYLNWSASKISDEYMPKGFKSPSSPGAVKTSLSGIRQDSFYKKDSVSGSFKFESGETLLEKASNLVSLVGVVALVIVIISKPYGKNTS